MSARVRSFATIVAAVVLLAAISPAAEARDREFQPIVDYIKANYKAKQTRIPFFGLARFAIKLARPRGLKSIKLAVFEDVDVSRAGDANGLPEVIRKSLGSKWKPLVRTYSRRSSEQTYVYARSAGKDVEIILVTLQEGEGTVLKAKVDPAKVTEWLAGEHGEINLD